MQGWVPVVEAHLRKQTKNKQTTLTPTPPVGLVVSHVTSRQPASGATKAVRTYGPHSLILLCRHKKGRKTLVLFGVLIFSVPRGQRPWLWMEGVSNEKRTCLVAHLYHANLGQLAETGPRSLRQKGILL